MEMSAEMVMQMSIQLGRMDQKIDEVLRILRNGHSNGNNGAKIGQSDAVGKALTSLTLKQHAVLQMLLNGKSNAEIAERLHVTENTAKVHVRLVARKAQATKRQQIVAFFKRAFDDCPDDEYKVMTGGLPKDWDEKWGTGTEEFDSILVP